MGLTDHYVVTNDQLTSSSNIDQTHTAADGRLYNTKSNSSGGSWIPGSETNQWITVKFDEPKLLSGVVTQGSPDSSRWMKTFYIYYSVNGVDFIPYTEYPGDQTPHLFHGNTDSNTPVTNLMNRDIIAQYIKIVPVEAGPGGIGVRFDVLGCKPDIPKLLISTPAPHVSSVPSGTTQAPKIVCDLSMGVNNPLIIGDSQLSSSSSLDFFHGPSRSRLDTVQFGSWAGAWSPSTTDDTPFIQLNLLSSYPISGVTTQGSADQPSWVTKYTVYYSNDGTNFQPIKDSSGNLVVFNGNTDQYSPVTNFFPQVSAQYIQIRPLESHNSIALRFNLLGCHSPTPSPPPFQTPSTPSITSPSVLYTPPDIYCNIPMNVDRPSMITNIQLTSSSQYNSLTSAANGRLENTLSSWVPSFSDKNRWHQVDFLTAQNLSGVLTQGSPNMENWVTSFTLSTSMDGLTFFPLRSDDGNIIVFKGNSDKDSIVRNYFPHTIFTRYIRLEPLTWAPDGAGLRVNYIGCFSSLVPTPRAPVPVETDSPIPKTTMTTLIPIIVPTPTFYDTSICNKEMGLQNQRIVNDNQLTASSFVESHEPVHARLSPDNYERSWMPLPSDSNPYIQVDFKELKFLSGVVTQGEGREESWVTKYSVYYSTDGVDFYPYSEKQDNVAKEFTANTDTNTPVTNYFTKNIIARYIRIVPLSSHQGVALRLEVLGCNPSMEMPPLLISTHPTPYPTIPTTTTVITDIPTLPGQTRPTTLTPSPQTLTTTFECLIPMGVSNHYQVTNDQLTSSTNIDQTHTAADGRLYNTKSNSSGGSWIPGSETNQWITVNFNEPRLLSGVVTQGSPDSTRWVKTFNIYYSVDGVHFIPYTLYPGDQTPYLFHGNNDSNTPVRNLFNREIIAQYIKIVPVEAGPGGIGLRFDVLGCTQLQPPIQTPTPHGVVMTTTLTPGTGTTLAPTLPATINCDIPMGLTNPMVINDKQLSSSSVLDTLHGPTRGRLSTYADGSLAGGWSPSTTDNTPFIQVDFLSSYPISGVTTQGSADQPSWVTKYTVYYSTDGTYFRPVRDVTGNPIIFNGNSDQNTPKTNFFPTISAQFIQIRPVESHNSIALRFDLFGCKAPNPTFVPPTPYSPTLAPTISTITTAAPNTVNPPSITTHGPYILVPNVPDMLCNVPMNVDVPTMMPPSHFQSSSHSTPQTAASEGRLNSVSSWIPLLADQNQWHQVDFGTAQNLSGILTQGSPNVDRWVSSFSISTSMDGYTFFPIRGNDGKRLIFTGNYDKNTLVRNYFPHLIVARYIRLEPVTWSPNGPGLRLNYIGCFSVAVPTPRPTLAAITLGPTFSTPKVTTTNQPPSDSPMPSTRAPTEKPLCIKEMGVQNQQIIQDSQITASSSTPNHGPGYGRLSPSDYLGSWIPLATDQSPYIQVDFKEVKLLSGVVTQGEGHEDKWVSSYKIETSVDGVHFYPYSDNQDGVAKIFKANVDTNSPVANFFNLNLLAQFIRIIPVRSHSAVAMRLDVFGCNPSTPRIDGSTHAPLYTTQSKPTTGVPNIPPQLSECTIPMGLSSHYLVTDDQITSSSNINTNHSAFEGRLYNQPSTTSGGSWIPSSGVNQWITVNFNEPKLLSGVVTQGSPDSSRWVKTFNIYYSVNGVDFIPYTLYPGDQTPYLFHGNNDSNTPVRNLLNREIIAQYIRIVPVEAGPGGIGLRFDVLGCQPPTPPPIILKPPIDVHTGSTLAPHLTTKPTCDIPMGLTNPLVISNTQLTASSSLDILHYPSRGRLYTSKDGSLAGGWSPSATDNSPYIQVDFLTPYLISGVVTQGSADQPSWVTKYTVYYSTDGTKFEPVRDNSGNRIIFNGNTDQYTPVSNFFTPVEARYIQIRPVEAHESIGLRFNVFGCQAPTPLPYINDVTPTPAIKSTAPTVTPFPPSIGTICNVPMEVEFHGSLPDSQLSASSSAGPLTSAASGRLFNKYTSWIPATSDQNKWLQVDFLRPEELSGILTQGSPNADKWVSSYTISTSLDGYNFYPIRNSDDKVIVFYGNSDKDAVMRNYFPHVIVTRYVRIVPVTWAPDGPGLRINYIGCFSSTYSTLRPPVPFINDVTPTTAVPTGLVTSPTKAPVCGRPMGLENQRIVEDKQISASSSAPQHGPEKARLSEYGYMGSWQPAESNGRHYIQVDFLEPKFLSGVVTQGEGQDNKWVTQYEVYMSVDGVNFVPYSERQDGLATVFKANTDTNTAVTNYFIRNSIARYIRIVPVSSYGGIAMRFNILGCNPTEENKSITTLSPPFTPQPTPTALLPPKACLIPMGLSSHYLVSNDQLTSSSNLDKNHTAADGRLFNVPSTTSGGSWIPSSNGQQWIMVNFNDAKLISGIVTQGSPDTSRWVQKYNVYYSLNGRDFTPYTETPGGTVPYTFNANSDSTTPVRNLFNRDIIAQYVKIVPVQASPSGFGLRFDVVGCQPLTPPMSIPTPLVIIDQVTAVPPTGSTQKPSIKITCELPMGVSNPLIVADGQLTASSSLDIFHGPTRGRLFTNQDGAWAGAWSPNITDNNQYIQVDFRGTYNISGVVTQGSPDQRSWVTKYIVYYSTDGVNFHPVTDSAHLPIVFKANNDQHTPVTNYFTPVEARFIQIRPVEFFGSIALRFNVLGCESPLPTPLPPLQTTSTVSPTLPNGQTPTPTPRACQYWSPWVSNSVPDPVSGEKDMFYQQPLVTNACPKEYIIGVECRVRATRMMWDPTDALVQCSLLDAMVSCTVTPTHPCPDHEMRVLCDVCSVSTTGQPVASPTLPGQSTITTAKPPPTCMSGWSNWINRDTVMVDGDREMMSIQEMVTFCPYGHVDQIICVTSDVDLRPWYQIDQLSSCDVSNGYKCDLQVNPNNVCQDVQVRYHCSCSGTPMPTPTLTPPPNLCTNSFWTQWINKDSPEIGDGDRESLSSHELSQICVGGYISEIDCQTTLGIPFDMTGEPVSCDLDSGLVCMNSIFRMCRNYRVRYRCECTVATPPTAVITTSSTLRPSTPTEHLCFTGWSGWINQNSPVGTTGDSEAMTTSQLQSFCPGGKITKVECVDAVSLVDFEQLSEASCSVNDGLQCMNNPFSDTPCHDYKLRYMCDCSVTPAPVSTPSSTPGFTCTNGWSSWINKNSPIGTTGDTEKITPEEINHFCYGGKLTNIQCVDSKTRDDFTSLAEATCTVQDGLECVNLPFTDIPPCRDYQVRYECNCTDAPTIPTTKSTSTLVPPHGSTLTTLVPPSGSTPTPQPQCHTGWSSWINDNTPIGNPGDHEKMTPEQLAQFCPGGKITDIECKDSDTKDDWTSLAEATCTVESGLECMNIPLDGIPPCRNYEIRYHCNCSDVIPLVITTKLPTPSIPTGSTASPLVCIDQWSPWINKNSPIGTDGDTEKMTPQELQRFCPGGEVTNIECKDSDTKDDWTSLAEATCSVENGLECVNLQIDGIPPCRDYQIRYQCNCTNVKPLAISTSTTKLPTPSIPTASTASPLVCINQWSAWINKNSPIGTNGDTEKMTTQELQRFCPGGEVTNIECKDSDTKDDWTSLAEATCSIENGLECVNLQIDGIPPCRDYEIRYQCNCSNVKISTQSPSLTPVHGSPTPSPNGGDGHTPSKGPTHSCTTGWSSWINKNNPVGSTGDTEKMTPEELANFCPGGRVTNIECKDSDTKDDWTSLAEATCSVENGLECVNLQIDGIPPCRNYEIRYMCNCSDNVPNPHTTLSPHHKIQVNCDWSDWLNVDSPTVGNGDMETIESIKSQYGVCPDMVNIQCRVAGTSTLFSQSGQDRLMCDTLNGFRCYNNEQKDGKCLDYEVRVLCWGDQCSNLSSTPFGVPTKGPHLSTTPATDEFKKTTGSCPPGEEWQVCAFKCDEVCGYVAHSSGACNGILNPADNCIPGCRPPPELQRVVCKPEERFINSTTCVPKEMCSCLKPDGTPAKAFETWQSPAHECSLCSCFSGEVICGSQEGCTTSSSSSHSYPTPQPCGWTDWINDNSPNATNGGDMELLSVLKPKYNLCTNPTRIICRDTMTGREASESGQVVTCSLAEGFKCYNHLNSDKCHDYEISVYCGCIPSHTPTISQGSSLSPIPASTSSPSGPHVCLTRWSDWINRNDPTHGTGDSEKMTKEELSDFCPGGKIVQIECKDSVTHDDYTSLAEATCTIEDGLDCANLPFDDVPPCRNYEIRYKCDCTSE
uniref:F5/8 type C domain-containing protein n=1 Tax=Biomphalaria glabrata TaxID=6526 RepID=A0A2C9K961_BIOGL